MDQDTTKNGSDAADGRDWRERLAAGNELPKISAEFAAADSQGQAEQQEPGAGGESPEPGPAPEAARQGSEQPRPRTVVTRPAPMAPRAPRPTSPETAGAPSRTGEARQPGFMPSISMPSSGAARQPQKSGDAAPAKSVSRPSWPESSRSETGSSSASRPSFPRVSPPAQGNDAFSERLRAQREAAERLAQHRLAAARQRSAQASGQVGKIVTVRRPDGDAPPAAPAPGPAQPPSKAQPHAAGADMPRFTFAEEEIAAAQRETTGHGDPATGGGREQPNVPPPYTPPPSAYGRADSPAAPQQRSEPPHAEPGGEADEGQYGAQPAAEHAHPPGASGSEPLAAMSGATYPVRPRDYGEDDEGMFEAEGPPVPPRASAADYTAAYREFEEDFDDDAPPRRRGGPLILLLSLLAVAIIGAGAIYWYQHQTPGTADSEAGAGDVPVVNAPAEPVKATPEPEEQPQEAAVPTRRKQIYDRILGEETLEPERIVPTEEQPQFRQIQQPQPQQGMPAEDQNQGFGSGEQNDSTDPRPLPLPPPPGTGDQGDLQLPDRSQPVTAAASKAPAAVRGAALRSSADVGRADALVAPVAQPASGAAAGQADQGDRTAQSPVRVTATRGSALQRTVREDGAQRRPVAAEPAAITRNTMPGPRTRQAKVGAITRDAAPEPTRPQAGPVATTGEAAASPTQTAPEAAASPMQRETGSDSSETASQPATEPVVESAAAEPPSQPPSGRLALQRDQTEAAVQDEDADASALVGAGDEPGSAPPIPRVKPEPPAPAPTRSASTSAPRAEPQRQTPLRSSGPVQITPTLLAPDSTASGSAPQVRQPSEPQPAGRGRRMGRQYDDPLAGTRSPISGSRQPSPDQLDKGAQNTAPDPAPQQVARTQPSQPSASQSDGASDGAASDAAASSSGASGYVVQLAAFRSESEAESEFQRLAQSHPGLVGSLSPRIQQASLGQSGSFYRLGVGPLGDRSTATRLCDALISAGEKDCLVRRH